MYGVLSWATEPTRNGDTMSNWTKADRNAAILTVRNGGPTATNGRIAAKHPAEVGASRSKGVISREDFARLSALHIVRKAAAPVCFESFEAVRPVADFFVELTPFGRACADYIINPTADNRAEVEGGWQRAERLQAEYDAEMAAA